MAKKNKKTPKIIVNSKRVEGFNPKIFYKSMFQKNSGDKRRITYELLLKNLLDEVDPPTKNDVKQSLLDLLTYAPIIELLLEDKKLTLTQQEMFKLLQFLNNHIYMYFRYFEKNFMRGYDIDKDYLSEVFEDED